ncbi:hypothetical protein KY348_04240 [Candidatus Woesearchaeota archaeon]|nr:hypothetical protein [Candidatus Woesearchaeota archaeon]
MSLRELLLKKNLRKGHDTTTSMNSKIAGTIEEYLEDHPFLSNIKLRKELSGLKTGYPDVSAFCKPTTNPYINNSKAFKSIQFKTVTKEILPPKQGITITFEFYSKEKGTSVKGGGYVHESYIYYKDKEKMITAIKENLSPEPVNIIHKYAFKLDSLF